jgi:hypothetical protein
MMPRMSAPEIIMLQSFLACSDNYLEYGSGGSTYAASQLISSSITSVDSSKDWLDKVSDACNRDQCRIKPNLIHVDIGPVGDWGRPIDNTARNLWPSYYFTPWSNTAIYDTDLYLIDGRFRVACFATILLGCRSDSIILIHDFSSRSGYQVVKEIAHEIARAGDLSAFIPTRSKGLRRVQEILGQYSHDPN